jgi:hypothetical protein
VHRGNFTFRRVSSCLSVSVLLSVLLGMRNVADKIVEKISTQDLCSITFENCVVYKRMWERIVEPGRPQIEHGACALHAEYLRLQIHTQNMLCFLLFHCNNGCTKAPQCYVIRTLHVLFFLTCGYNIVKGDSYLLHVCPYAQDNLTPTGHIFIKFCI